jgi:phosphopantothenoylcysteine decarboxylase/phosphopantothenate--cysteine ligase
MHVRSAEQMAAATLDASQAADALIMAAAVADFRPVQAADHKIKKGDKAYTLNLAPTPDILMQIAQLVETQGAPRVRIGFAAETEDLLVNAAHKRQKKGLDLIVANDISAPDAGFEVDTNRVTFLFADGSQKTLPLLTKAEVAEHVIQELVRLLDSRDQNTSEVP